VQITPWKKQHTKKKNMVSQYPNPTSGVKFAAFSLIPRPQTPTNFHQLEVLTPLSLDERLF
jgi:hypothetical protein